MTEETKAGLKVLAEYMGLQACEKSSIVDYVDNEVSLHSLTYNTSWDALVPVYSKVMSYIKHKMHIRYSPRAKAIDGNYIMFVKKNNPQAAFEAVVKLVKIINKEKE